MLDYCPTGHPGGGLFPIAHGEALKNPAINAMAEKYGVSVPQLCIHYVLQLGSGGPAQDGRTPGHMRSNAAVDFAISPEDMETLRSMEHLTDYGDYNGFSGVQRQSRWRERRRMMRKLKNGAACCWPC